MNAENYSSCVAAVFGLSRVSAAQNRRADAFGGKIKRSSGFGVQRYGKLGDVELQGYRVPSSLFFPACSLHATFTHQIHITSFFFLNRESGS